MNWTTPKDIKDRWISAKMIPSDIKLELFIKDVESQILRKYPAIQERIDNNLISIDIIVATVSRIIIEFLLTEGSPYSQESQSYTGVGSRSVSITATSRKSLQLTESDLDIFSPNDVGNDGFVSVRMKYDNNDKDFDWVKILWVC